MHYDNKGGLDADESASHINSTFVKDTFSERTVQDCLAHVRMGHCLRQRFARSGHPSGIDDESLPKLLKDNLQQTKRQLQELWGHQE